MEAKVNYAIVGAFVLVLGAALIGGVLWLSSGGVYRKAYDTYQAYMSESVSGLSLDAPVRYRGVEVGRVRKIALAPEDIEQVQLTLDIERGTPIKEDTVAVLRVQGLTGIAFVELSGGGRESPPLQARPGEAYPRIRTEPSLMVRLDTTLTTLLANLNRTSESLNAVMDEANRHTFKQALTEIEALTRTIARRSATIDAGLVNASHVLENAARISAEMPRLVERVQRGAEAFEKMSNDVAGASAGVTRTVEATRGDVRQFTAATLPEAQQLVSDLRELTSSLKRVAGELEQNPSVLLFGKPAQKKGPGE
jgi:phospholipid/cholesterol/gamma-HCH transport system substrate-binding protein